MFDGLNHESLVARERALSTEFETLKSAGLALDLTRGKPSPEQVALSDALDDALGNDYRLDDGTDVRNYGGLPGIPEARRLGAELLGVRPEEAIAGGNASLTFMHQYVLHAWLNGPLGPQTAWRREPGPLKFLCVVPGYDRHFMITESLGFELINVPIDGGGPDMERVEALVADDPGIKGIWCVPKYSNPTGHVYSDEVVERFAHLARRAGPNFRILWDNAYAVHDFDDDPPVLANLMERCRAAGTEDSVVLFGSTSKITRAGAGISFMAASPANLASFTKFLAVQTIGPDKVNQLRHVRFLRDGAGIRAHMRRQAAIVRPKFERVLHHLAHGLAADGLGSWSRPRGGYFLSFEAPDGLATGIVSLAGEAGVKLTPAGATFPYGRDRRDSNIRIAPTYPSLDEIDRAMPVFVTAVSLAAARQRLQQSAVHA
jgi:aspartate/methionine/tyrosine aminotransferase